ncbi:MAG: hypothetical protein K8W52_23295 [Deltaproteobacteria bacterium]|nr:hypothetical protein [Deltaproteobacteria bacterium]
MTRRSAGAPAVEKEARVVAVAVAAGTWIVDVYPHARTPEDGWFDIDAGRRKLAAFPLGLASEVASAPLQELASELRSPRRRG